jgi:hypothetical protein
MRVAFHQTKNGLSRLRDLLEVLERARRDLVVDRLHALAGQRTRVLDLLRAIGMRPAMDDARVARSAL